LPCNAETKELKLQGVKKYSISNLRRSIITYSLSPHGFALSFTVGLACGLFPVIGLTTILSALAALIFRCNMWVVQAVNWLAASLQIIMIIPFIRMGELISGKENSIVATSGFQFVFSGNWKKSIGVVLEAQTYAIVAWLLLIIPLGFAIYHFTRYLVIRNKKRKESLS
jgi:uncharacterized protein (DUF2062 family)